MFTPPNRHGTPDTSSTSAISSPEGLLQLQLLDELLPEVHRRLAKELERTVEHSPISKLSFDPLSIIFELCAEADWTAPLRIAAVSRTWREVVLQSPRAWCSVDSKRSGGVWLLGLFSERCGQRPLHVATYGDVLQGLKAAFPAVLASLERSDPPRHWFNSTNLVERVANKIRCMSVNNLTTARRAIAYINLTRLRIARVKPDVKLSDISSERFPALLHLEMVGALYQDEDSSSARTFDLPKLQTLKLTANHNSAWLRLVKHCQDSLVSLSIIIRGDYFPQEDVSEIQLPHLQCLQINTPGTRAENLWRSTFQTPSLTSYVEINGSGPVDELLHDDVSKVTHLRLNQSNFPLRSPLPELSVLQLEATSRTIHNIVPQVEAHSKLAKQLKLVEVRFRDAVHADLEGIRMNVQEKLTGLSILWELVLTTGKWNIELPAIITCLCGDNMPCNL